MRINKAPFKYFAVIVNNEIELKPLHVAAAGDINSLIFLLNHNQDKADIPFDLKKCPVLEITQNEFMNLLKIDSMKDLPNITLDWRKSFKAIMFDVSKKSASIVTEETDIPQRLVKDWFKDES